MAEAVVAVGVVLAAGISALASLLVARLRTDNSEQHAANLAKLDSVAADVCEVKTDVRQVRAAHDRHLEWHAER